MKQFLNLSTGPDCTVQSPEVNDNRNNDCDWLVDEELLDGIDNDNDGRIDEDVAANKLYPVRNITSREIEQSPRKYIYTHEHVSVPLFSV